MADVPKSWIRMGVLSEKKLLISNKRLYHGLVVPAHVLAMYEMAMTQFLQDLGKPYFIDPMSFIFFHSHVTERGRGGRRKSYEKMIREVPESETYLDRHVISPSHLKSNERNELARIIGELCFKSQHPTGTRAKARKSLARIRTSRTARAEPADGQMPPPEFMVAPYVFFRDLGDEYDFWRKTVESFLDTKPSSNLPIYEVICTDPSFLGRRRWVKKVVRDIASEDGVLFWISDFERRTDIKAMAGLKDLIHQLKEKGVGQIYGLYGGYLTALFSEFGLDGLSFSLAYGEAKAVGDTAAGGGLPLRYYDPSLHQFQSLMPIRTYYQYRPDRFGCSCSVCDTLSTQISGFSPLKARKKIGSEFPIHKGKTESWKSMRQHFIEVRQSELERVGSEPLSKLVKEARDTLNVLAPDLDAFDLKITYLKLVSQMDSIV